MEEEIREKILKWIFKNHEHHYDIDDKISCECVDAEYPYVNSIELEKFIKEL